MPSGINRSEKRIIYRFPESRPGGHRARRYSTAAGRDLRACTRYARVITIRICICVARAKRNT